MVGTTGDPAGKDNHKGCLGVGDLQGRLLPTLVPGPLQTVLAVQVVAGLNFTAVVTSTHKVYQAGQLAPHRSVKWSSCTTFEQVGGPLERFWTDELTAGMQHCVATARAVDFKNGHPVPSGTRYVFTWGRGQEGQLGCGTCSESGVPVIVQAMQGRKVQQVAAGGYYAMAVCEHNSQSEDVEELQQLQVARDFFRHRFKVIGWCVGGGCFCIGWCRAWIMFVCPCTVCVYSSYVLCVFIVYVVCIHILSAPVQPQ